MKNLTLSIFLVALSICTAYGQKARSPAKVPEKASGIISGTISDETGAPVEDAEISLSAAGSQKAGDFFKETTDRAGKFSFENLKPRRYKIYVRCAGYVLSEAFEPGALIPKTYSVNQPVNLIVRKGGVITGKVLDETGQPFIRIRIRAVKIRDEFGQKIPAQEFEQYSQQHFTDDRGIYRIFGLAAGSYLIFVGGGDYFSEQKLAIKESSPVYHPSDPVDTAEEIRVGYGQENGAVDINIRQIQGFRVSGTIVGAKSNAANNGSVTVSLISAVNGIEIVQTLVYQRDGKYAFKFEQIPDGDYEIRGFQFGDGGVFPKNSLQKTTVRGADVSGLIVNLKMPNSIKGNVSIEKNANLNAFKDCAKPAETAVTSMIVKFVSSAPEKSVLDLIENTQQNIYGAPEDNGDFTVDGLENGKYFLKVNSLDPNLYVREILQQISAKEKRDLSGGINLSTGADLTNVKIIFSDGAAQVNGKITVPEKEKAEMSAATFNVYLVPADEADKNNILRYAQSISGAGGKFSFENVAPGDYFLSAESYSADKDVLQKSAIPKFWNLEKRSQLFQSAKNEMNNLTVKPCQNSAIEIESVVK